MFVNCRRQTSTSFYIYTYITFYPFLYIYFFIFNIFIVFLSTYLQNIIKIPKILRLMM
nr:MAG TPA: hypothetical protein [Caudoviricetes sp.]